MAKKLWDKMIGDGERVVYEFTIGAKWRRFRMGLVTIAAK